MTRSTLPASSSAPVRSAWRLLLTASAVLWLLAAPTWAAGADETLAVFVRDTGSPVAEAFAAEHLPGLREAAADLGLEVRVIDVAAEGAPESVGLTPLIAHVGRLGTSIYQGRYVDAGKVGHFVRTSRVVPPTGDAAVLENVAALGLGRATVVAPLKITGLSGAVPAGHDAGAFAERARSAFEQGLERFARRAEVTLGPSGRAFYMDVHPYLGDDGTLALSLDLYSQFHCLEPVFRRFDEPVTGPWAEAETVFAEAARVLEAEVLRQLETSEIGDGFDPVPADAKVATWSDLGLEVARQELSAAEVAGVELPLRWRLAEPESGAPPRLIFRFPAPLERYSGEVPRFDAALALPAPKQLAGAGGWVRADASSVTFGEKDLDKAVQGKLLVSRFATARFDLETVQADAQPLAFGRSSLIHAAGTFSMMGYERPVDVGAEVQPIIGAEGEPRLHVRARFELRLEKPFGLKGPDGPEPARDTLQFFLDFELVPDDADHSASAGTAP